MLGRGGTKTYTKTGLLIQIVIALALLIASVAVTEFNSYTLAGILFLIFMTRVIRIVKYIAILIYIKHSGMQINISKPSVPQSYSQEEVNNYWNNHNINNQ